MKTRYKLFAICFWFVIFSVACYPEGSPTSTIPFPEPSDEDEKLGLTSAEASTLLSLEKVDDHPLYTMHYYAEYETIPLAGTTDLIPKREPADLSLVQLPWACSLFAALADPENRLYGRNFDWEFSPAVLLFTHPADGYASVSMVDIAYLGFSSTSLANLQETELKDRLALLNAPAIPFDGMNEAGLAIGMAAVPSGNIKPDPTKPTVGSLGIIRVILDQAATVKDAIPLFESYNIDFEGGPPIHYLIADASGEAALIEFYQGDMHVLKNQNPWYQATNFLASSVFSPDGQCWRYDKISQTLADVSGNLSVLDAIDLLSDVSQGMTQWSLVYGMSTGQIQIVMAQNYKDIHVFDLEPATP